MGGSGLTGTGRSIPPFIIQLIEYLRLLNTVLSYFFDRGMISQANIRWYIFESSLLRRLQRFVPSFFILLALLALTMA